MAWTHEAALTVLLGTTAGVAAQPVAGEGAAAMVGAPSFVGCATNGAFHEESDIVSFADAGVPRECFTARAIAP